MGLALVIASPALAKDTTPATAAANAAATQTDQTQTTPPADITSEPKPTSDKDIIVTGTRIRQPNLNSPVPVTSLTIDQLPSQGQLSIGDSLNDLPALRSTFSQQNSGRFIGTAGLNLLDLRGLGTSRTLVLVNGRRHITASAGDFQVDTQTIPVDLLERVDIVTGGQSAVYGSDAIAGVVNFVTKRDFDGYRLRAQGGISAQGDRGVDFISGTIGKNFADGRGNIAVNVEYAHASPLYFNDRARGRQVCGFEPIEDTTNEPQAGNGKPDNGFVCGIRNPGVTVGGDIGLLSLDGTLLSFTPNGNLVRATPSQSFIANGGGVISDDPLTGATLNETGQLAVGSDRINTNLLAHFDVSDAFKPFVEAKYVHLRVLQEGQPSFVQGQLSSFFGSIVPNLLCGNPFLNAQARGQLTNTVSTCAMRTPAGAIALDANGARIFDPNRPVPMNRFNVDFGGRGEIDKRDTYRIVAGVEGDFNTDWHYEVSANYGHFQSRETNLNDLQIADINGNPAGFALAVDAVRDPAGNIVCRSTLTNPGNGCVPINLFGYGAPSQAALNYVNTTSFLESHAAELDILAYVSGTTQKWFSLPGGPVGFSVGGEYRRETAEQHADALSSSGATFFNAFPNFDPPAFSVKEIYGELNLPLLKDLPFAKELTVSGAARYSSYNTSAGDTFAWNANVVYAPVSDVKFRANYSKSVRVPTLSDLYTSPTVNFAFLDDPCNQRNINNGTPSRKDNCAALGVPTKILAGAPCDPGQFAVGDPFVNCPAENANVQITSSGNPNLKAEKGRSITVGTVITPRFLPGFSATVDYFDIQVTNLIATLDGQTILNQCVDQPTIQNQYCALVAPRDQFGFFAKPALTSAGINYAKQTSRGIDFDLSYNRRFNNGWSLALRGLATYTLERNNYTDPNNPGIYSRQLSNLGDPVFSSSLSADLDMNGFQLSYTVRYIGKMTIFDYADTHSVQGRPAQNPDEADQVYYPSTFYHDVKIGYKVNRDFTFYTGVDNLFDTNPPLGLTGSGEGSGIYDGIGRFFYAGVTANF